MIPAQKCLKLAFFLMASRGDTLVAKKRCGCVEVLQTREHRPRDQFTTIWQPAMVKKNGIFPGCEWLLNVMAVTGKMLIHPTHAALQTGQ